MFLTKHHGLGNDFLLALDEHPRNQRPLTVDGELARAVCDRRRGIGADGLIHGARPTDEQVDAGVDVVMHLFNSDGSRAELSGNGARCLGQAVALARSTTIGAVDALTDAGRRVLAITEAEGPTWMVSVGMGEPGPGPAVPPEVVQHLGAARFDTVDMGNPHLVVLVDAPDDIDLGVDGPWIEKHFVDGINVEYIRGVPGETAIELRVWERGAGITEACGTGACAAAVQWARWHPGAAGVELEVRMPGGSVTVARDGDDVTLIGPSTYVGEIEIPDGWRA